MKYIGRKKARSLLLKHSQSFMSLLCSLLMRYLGDHPIHKNKTLGFKNLDQLPKDGYSTLMTFAELAGIEKRQYVFSKIPLSEHAGLWLKWKIYNYAGHSCVSCTTILSLTQRHSAIIRLRDIGVKSRQFQDLVNGLILTVRLERHNQLIWASAVFIFFEVDSVGEQWTTAENNNYIIIIMNYDNYILQIYYTIIIIP